MGRNAKLRKQRKEGNLAGDIPASKQSASAKKSQEQSFFGKVASWVKRAPSVAQDSVEIQALKFSEKNNIALGAIAWEGFQKSGKGLVFVEDAGDSSKMEYVPQKFVKKTLNTRGLHPDDAKAIANMVEVYNPENGLVMVYVSPTGEITATSTPKLDPTPPECYRLHKETK